MICGAYRGSRCRVTTFDPHRSEEKGEVTTVTSAGGVGHGLALINKHWSSYWLFWDLLPLTLVLLIICV